MRDAVASFLAVLLLSACAATGPTYTEHLGASRAVPPSHARLVFFRTKDSAQYSARTASLKLNGEPLGNCEYGGFSVFDVAAGNHALDVDLWDSPGTCNVRVQVAGGERYYFQLTPRAGNLAGGLMGGLIGMTVESSLAGECGGAFSVRSVPPEFATARLADLKLTQAATLPSSGALQRVVPQQNIGQPRALQPPAEAVESRLKELRAWRDAGLIGEDVYLDQQRRALGLH